MGFPRVVITLFTHNLLQILPTVLAHSDTDQRNKRQFSSPQHRETRQNVVVSEVYLRTVLKNWKSYRSQMPAWMNKAFKTIYHSHQPTPTRMVEILLLLKCNSLSWWGAIYLWQFVGNLLHQTSRRNRFPRYSIRESVSSSSLEEPLTSKLVIKILHLLPSRGKSV